MESVKLYIVNILLRFTVKIAKRLAFYQSVYTVGDEIEEVVKSQKFDMRGMSDRLKNIIIHDQDVIDKRWAICQECEFLTEKNRCRKCGCFMKKKITFAVVDCPIGKWGKEYDFMKGRTLNGSTTTTELQ